jgi:hypothetical protein
MPAGGSIGSPHEHPLPVMFISPVKVSFQGHHWAKVSAKTTGEAIVGGIVGPPHTPTSLILGRTTLTAG